MVKLSEHHGILGPIIQGTTSVYFDVLRHITHFYTMSYIQHQAKTALLTFLETLSFAKF